MTAEEYLDQIQKIDDIISNRREDYKRWVEIASGLGDFSVSERVQSTRNLQKNQNAIISYVAIEKEIDELNRKRDEIIRTIERLPSGEYKVIYRIYVKGNSLKEIAYELRKSYEWAKQRKQRGLALVQQMIDGGTV